MSWGDTYKGKFETFSVASIIEEEATHIGMAVHRFVDPRNRIMINTTQTAPWYRILFLGLPQRIQWILWQKNGRSYISRDARFFRWYFILIISIYAMTIVCFYIGLIHSLPESTSFLGLRYVFKIICIPLSCMLIFLNWSLLFLRVSRLNYDFWQVIQTKIETATGDAVEQIQTRGGSRGLLRMGSYLGFVGSLIVWLIIKKLLHPSGYTLSPLEWFILIMLSSVALVLSGSLAFSLSKKGFSMRLMPMIPGLSTVCFLLAFLTAQWFWIIPADMIIELVKQEKVISHILTIANDSSDPLNQKYQQNKEGIHTILILVSQYLKTWGWMVIGFTLFCIGLSMIMVLNGIDYCVRSFLALHGLMKRPWQKTIEAAISGRKFLAQFRLIFIGVWLLCAGLILIGIYYLSCLFFHALPGIWDDSCFTGFTRILQTSIYLVDKAFGFSPGRSQSAVRIAWLIYGGCGVGLIIFSLSSLVYSRHTHFKKLINSSFIPTKAYQQVHDKLLALSEKAGISCPKLVITENECPFAYSHTFGLFKKTEFIEISSRCVNKFKDAEIEALLAHELSHHLNGDHRLHNLLRLLGRLTLVGDTFTCAIEDSFGYESKADETAVVQLHAEAQALKHVLWRIRNIYGAEEGLSAPAMEGLAAFTITQGDYQKIVKMLVKGVQSLPFRTRWCLAIKVYLAQYYSSSNTSYWYPSIELRISALDALAVEQN